MNLFESNQDVRKYVTKAECILYSVFFFIGTWIPYSSGSIWERDPTGWHWWIPIALYGYLYLSIFYAVITLLPQPLFRYFLAGFPFNWTVLLVARIGVLALLFVTMIAFIWWSVSLFANIMRKLRS